MVRPKNNVQSVQTTDLSTIPTYLRTYLSNLLPTTSAFTIHEGSWAGAMLQSRPYIRRQGLVPY